MSPIASRNRARKWFMCICGKKGAAGSLLPLNKGAGHPSEHVGSAGPVHLTEVHWSRADSQRCSGRPDAGQQVTPRYRCRPFVNHRAPIVGTCDVVGRPRRLS